MSNRKERGSISAPCDASRIDAERPVEGDEGHRTYPVCHHDRMIEGASPPIRAGDGFPNLIAGPIEPNAGRVAYNHEWWSLELT